MTVSISILLLQLTSIIMEPFFIFFRSSLYIILCLLKTSQNTAFTMMSKFAIVLLNLSIVSMSYMVMSAPSPSEFLLLRRPHFRCPTLQLYTRTKAFRYKEPHSILLLRPRSDYFSKKHAGCLKHFFPCNGRHILFNQNICNFSALNRMDPSE